MCLTGDAKLWCQTQQEDDVLASRTIFSSWNELKKELREQFLFGNTVRVARTALKKVKHMVIVWDYDKEFSSFMLDIQDMSGDDKLFNFLTSVQH